jgi:hypothetical protein
MLQNTDKPKYKRKTKQQPYATSANKLIKCLCPLCNKIHKLMIHWTGRGIPRIYCDTCKKKLNNN